ncbi:hypothetical protein BH23BAC1_BH23BAC1_47490 [soil metagenome]
MPKISIYCGIIFCLIFISCYTKDEVPANIWEDFKPFKPDYNSSDLQNSDLFVSKGAAVGAVNLPEVSGLAESQVNPDHIWAHNDSGNSNSIFLINKNTGKISVEYVVSGAKNVDWEDMEIGPGPENGKSYIYMGDIGDNQAIRSKSIIYRFPEPEFDTSQEGQKIELNNNLEVLEYTYPEGARDAETLLLDHKTKDLYIISKRELPAKVFIFPYPQNIKASTKLVQVGSLPFFMPVGGNVSPDGKEILIKTYQTIYFWQHDFNEPLWKTLAKQPQIAPYDPVEPQGEAISFDSKGGYFTLSEKVNNTQPILYYYQRK